MNSLAKSKQTHKTPKTYYHPNAVADRKLVKQLENKFEDWLKISNWFEAEFDLKEGTNWKQLDYKTMPDEPKKIFIELKGRRCKKWKYNTTIIGHNKYIKARKMMMKGYTVFFFFQFKDELCFYEVPMILPKSIEIKLAGTNKRGSPEYKDHLYIPIPLLKNVLDFPCYDYWVNQKKIEQIHLEQMRKNEFMLNNEDFPAINKKIEVNV